MSKRQLDFCIHMTTRERSTQRLACDRCHGQKLRCIRGSLPTGACQRCIKAKAMCQYSSPLRLGRPAKPDPAKNMPPTTGGRRRSSTALPSPHESSTSTTSTSTTDGIPEGQSEEDCTMNLSQLEFFDVQGMLALPLQEEAHVGKNVPTFPIKTFEWDMEDRTDEHNSSIIQSSTQTPQGLDVKGPPRVAKTDSSSEFILDDYIRHLAPDSADGIQFQTLSAADSFNTDPVDAWAGSLSVDTLLAHGSLAKTRPPPATAPLQSSAQDDVQRQLSELLRRLHETPHHSPMMASATNNHNSASNPQLMDETVKAAHALISIIDSVHVSTAPLESRHNPDAVDPTTSFIDAGTVFLAAACYYRIFRNSNTLAVVMHDAVSSNDMATLRSMPSIKIGSVTPLHTTSPAIQSALWVQLLWQSLRELEKRLLMLSHRSAVLSPLATESSLQPGNRSHLADLTAGMDGEVARLEVSVNHLLKTTLDTLRHKSF
ncbi:hypothetical protein M406DRAFT_327298 [Cryphonectria parasitica EP155]|uniref:Zn(2)-C6 fungal-type domain-containing protein n=1 Tax=Cryphonectria parasitica (strain ATCC 38755 / EP155) TaxID=660469 RepID=A0A9P4Y8S7_CRYP1|nr:uncharacterized protein M406DRAFT_327298 [Cryphonectria parasitica EP155]KAF3768883.1 hypothetical protein M406DRAFT_327298 [Cryphonectria parasitica EP155]